MHVRVRLDGANPRRWHVALLTRLSGLPGIEAVSVEAAPGRTVGRSRPTSCSGWNP